MIGKGPDEILSFNDQNLSSEISLFNVYSLYGYFFGENGGKQR